MAIVSLVLFHAPQDRRRLLDLLGSDPRFMGTSAVGEDKIAASLCCPAAELPSFLQKLSDLPQTLDLQLIFASYEDEIDKDGHLPMPPEAKKYV